MSDETIKWIYGTVGSIALAVVGYFVNKRLKKKEQESNRVGTDLINFGTIVEIFESAQKELRTEVSELRAEAEQIPILVSKINTLQKDFETCREEMESRMKDMGL